MASTQSNTGKSPDKDKDELPGAWQQAEVVIWLVGLAVLAWQGWWWPGILILSAIGGIYHAVVRVYLSRQDNVKEVKAQTARLDEERSVWIPASCPSCGGPINIQTLIWTGPQSGSCPYCSTNIKP